MNTSTNTSARKVEIRNEIRILPEQEYPELLRKNEHKPDILYCAGAPPDNSHSLLCVVGSRDHSNYGEEVCKSLIRGLRGYPITIVSGLAIGIDSVAHRTALENGIKTIAMPGSGLDDDVMYPRSHIGLARQIIMSNSTLMSPFKPDQCGARWTFPVRNRLMASMCHAVLVIEARKGSGTLITAEYALQSGRDVLAVPGTIFSELSYGPHMLISNGAKLVCETKDILEALNIELHKNDSGPNSTTNANNGTPYQNHLMLGDLGEHERIIYERLIDRPSDATTLAISTGFSPALLGSTLTMLEIRGIISQYRGVYKISR